MVQVIVHGLQDYLTADLWFCRSWYRIMGGLLIPKKAGASAKGSQNSRSLRVQGTFQLQEIPRENDRAVMQQAMEEVVKRLQLLRPKETWTVARAQAVLWYAEQELYGTLTGKPFLSSDYGESAKAALAKLGDIEKAAALPQTVSEKVGVELSFGENSFFASVKLPGMNMTLEDLVQSLPKRARKAVTVDALRRIVSLVASKTQTVVSNIKYGPGHYLDYPAQTAGTASAMALSPKEAEFFADALGIYLQQQGMAVFTLDLQDTGEANGMAAVVRFPEDVKLNLELRQDFFRALRKRLPGALKPTGANFMERGFLIGMSKDGKPNVFQGLLDSESRMAEIYHEAFDQAVAEVFGPEMKPLVELDFQPAIATFPGNDWATNVAGEEYLRHIEEGIIDVGKLDQKAVRTPEQADSQRRSNLAKHLRQHWDRTQWVVGLAVGRAVRRSGGKLTEAQEAELRALEALKPKDYPRHTQYKRARSKAETAALKALEANTLLPPTNSYADVVERTTAREGLSAQFAAAEAEATAKALKEQQDRWTRLGQKPPALGTVQVDEDLTTEDILSEETQGARFKHDQVTPEVMLSRKRDVRAEVAKPSPVLRDAVRMAFGTPSAVMARNLAERVKTSVADPAKRAELYRRFIRFVQGFDRAQDRGVGETYDETINHFKAKYLSPLGRIVSQMPAELQKTWLRDLRMRNWRKNPYLREIRALLDRQSQEFLERGWIDEIDPNYVPRSYDPNKIAKNFARWVETVAKWTFDKNMKEWQDLQVRAWKAQRAADIKKHPPSLAEFAQKKKEAAEKAWQTRWAGKGKTMPTGLGALTDEQIEAWKDEEARLKEPMPASITQMDADDAKEMQARAEKAAYNIAQNIIQGRQTRDLDKFMDQDGPGRPQMLRSRVLDFIPDSELLDFMYDDHTYGLFQAMQNAFVYGAWEERVTTMSPMGGFKRLYDDLLDAGYDQGNLDQLRTIVKGWGGQYGGRTVTQMRQHLAVNRLRALITLKMMGLVALKSLPEAFAPTMRAATNDPLATTKHMVKGFGGLSLALMDKGMEGLAKKIGLNYLSENEVRRMAREIGVYVHGYMNELMQRRDVGETDMLDWSDKLIVRFYRGNALDQLTRAERIIAVGTAISFIKHSLRKVNSQKPGSHSYNIHMGLLQELGGLDQADGKAMLAHLTGQSKSEAMERKYQHMVMRFVAESIMEPGRQDRSPLNNSNNPWIKAMFLFQGYMYAADNKIRRRWTDQISISKKSLQDGTTYRHVNAGPLVAGLVPMAMAGLIQFLMMGLTARDEEEKDTDPFMGVSSRTWMSLLAMAAGGGLLGTLTIPGMLTLSVTSWGKDPLAYMGGAFYSALGKAFVSLAGIGKKALQEGVIDQDWNAVGYEAFKAIEMNMNPLTSLWPDYRSRLQAGDWGVASRLGLTPANYGAEDDEE